MGKVVEYREILRTLDGWDSFLLQASGLPGPRGNIELAQAVADEGSEELFRRYLSFDADRAPTNSPYEFLAFCGTVGLGRLLADGKRTLEKWFSSDDKDVIWILKQNLRKKRLARIDAEWVEKWSMQLRT